MHIYGRWSKAGRIYYPLNLIFCRYIISIFSDSFSCINTLKYFQDAKIIEGSRFIVKPRALGLKICAFIGVVLDNAHQYRAVVKELKKIPEITECHFITGHYTFLLKLRCNNHQHLMDVLVNTLQNIPGIAKTESFIALDQIIEKEVDPLPEERA